MPTCPIGLTYRPVHVVIIDEAGMADTRSLATAVTFIAEARQQHPAGR